MGILSIQRYDTAADVQLRLNNSVVLYQERPCFVGQGLVHNPTGAGDLYLDVFDMLRSKWLDNRVHSSDEELDVRSQRLGYINHQGQAIYVARLPCRRQRQGLTRENTFVYYTGEQTDVRVGDGRRTENGIQTNISNEMLKSKAFADMMVNDYPSYQAAIAALCKDKTRSVAFGRKLMIMEDEIGLIKLHYFTTALGLYNKKKDVFTLPDRFEHYLTVLKSHGVPVVIND